MIELDPTDDRPRRRERGFALLGVIVLAAFLMAVLAAYVFLSTSERTASVASMDSTRGFYAAEAGLNVRFNQLRGRFENFSQPSGASPATVAGQLECTGTDLGSGDFACVEYGLEGRDVLTYVADDPGNPSSIVVPRGELYQNLRALEYIYDIKSAATANRQNAEALLEMRVRTRLVPLFQFAAFYNKDLEILPGPAMTFNGPIHTNGDLYLGSGDTLTVNGQLTTAGRLFNGRKDSNCCSTRGIFVYDPAVPAEIPDDDEEGDPRIELTEPELVGWNGMIRVDTDATEVPLPEELDPTPGQLYWDKADLRVMLDLNGGTPAIQVRDAADTVDATLTATLNACAGAPSYTTTMYNFRESSTIDMLDVDVTALVDCLQLNGSLMGGKGIDDATEGGLVWYFGVDGPSSGVANTYGVRVSNGARVDSTLTGAPPVRGLTLVTDQALYVQGDFNNVAKKPAAVLADSLNVLSNAWTDAKSGDPLNDRVATDTSIYAAFLAGTDTTGGVEGVTGQGLGVYNGGLENYPRFHESWSGKRLTYRGSFVSLNTPRHVDGPWSDQSYRAPIRDWGYDLDFNDPTRLPPLTPRFVYVRQDLFFREFDL